MSEHYCPTCKGNWTKAFNMDHNCVTCGSRVRTIDSHAMQVSRQLEQWSKERYRARMRQLTKGKKVSQMSNPNYMEYMDCKRKADRIEQAASLLRADAKEGYTL